MGKWGQKNKWAKLFFTPLDSPGEVEEAHATSSSSSISTTTKELSPQREHRKKAQSPSTWKCSRCEAVITVPLDVTTKRPSFVVFAQHLEGNNKNVPVCAAGAIKYEEERNAASDATAASSLPENPKPTPESQEKETITQLEKVLREANASNGARIIIAVDDPKTPANMGSILRAVHCYGASGVIYSGERLNEALKHTPTDTRQSWRRIPIVHTPKLSSLIKVVKSMQEARVNSERKGENIDTHEGAAAVDVPQVHLIAVDLIDAAEPLPLFIHPDQRTGAAAARIEGGNHADASVATMVVVVYVFGPEDGTLSQETIDSCDAAVYMPTVGSMNLAASVNVLLYDRCAKHVRNASGDAIRMEKRVREGESSEIAGTIDDEKRNRENENDNNSDDDDDAMRRLEADVMRNRNPNNRTKWQKPASN